MSRKFKIKTGDEVIVIAGRSKGKRGEVTRVVTNSARVFVKGVNLVRRHTKPSAQSQGGILEKEASIHISNVSLIDPSTNKATKVAYKLGEKGQKTRISRKSGEILDK